MLYTDTQFEIDVQSLATITPAPDEHDRVLFVGTTGSGKTTLARVLLSSRAYVVVLDVKGTLNWPSYRLVRRLRDLARIDSERVQRIIYRPHYAELNRIDPFFRWVLERGNTTLYVDELMYVGGLGEGVVPIHYLACLTRGRELGVEVWSATQRPANIPLVAISEAEHVFCFRLQLPQDRGRIEEITGITVETIQALKKRAFVYARQGESEIMGPYQLEFDKRPSAEGLDVHNSSRAPSMGAVGAS